MFKKALIEIIVAFCPKKSRADLRHKLRYYNNYLYVKKTACKVGEHFLPGKNILINKRTEIGNEVIINGIFVQGTGRLSIGNYVKIGIDLLVLTSNHNYESNKIPYGDKETAKDVKIEDFCWIGSRVTLLPGTELEEGCIVQAGSVVHGKFPAGSIIGGNPAKVFKTRDMENYKQNKKNQAYFVNTI